MGDHLINGKFKSDKYEWAPAGFLPLKITDPMARSLLWEYAQRRRAVDAEFAADLEEALKIAGFTPPDMDSDTLGMYVQAIADVLEAGRNDASQSVAYLRDAARRLRR